MSEPGGKPFTPEMQKAAAAAFAGVTESAQEAAPEPAAPEAPEAPEELEAEEAAPEAAEAPSEEDVDLDDFAKSLLEEEADTKSGPNARENEQKTRLVELGLSEQAAHSLAFHGGAKNAQKVIDALSGGVSSEVAQPAPVPEGDSEPGLRLPESVMDELGGPAAKDLGSALSQHFAALEARVAALQEQVLTRESSIARESMSQARTELMETYPELRSSAEVEALKPLIRAAAKSGFASSPGEAFRDAVIKRFGPRAGTSTEATAETSDSVPSPGKATKVGSKAATPEKVRGRIAEMIFNNRPSDEVLGFADDMNRRMK